MMLSICLALLIASPALATNTVYCSTNTLTTNTSWLQFTKEPVPMEYGIEDKFKSIHCCGRGYRSIEWFKDNVAYPWSAGVSNLILYPEAANQTLYTRRASRHDSGNYTCRISNETHSETHTVMLQVLEKPPDAPKTMFITKDQWVAEGTDLRLYCEALVGRSYLADTQSDLRWRKVFANGTEGDLLPTQAEIKTQREDIPDIIGSYLVLGRVQAADYGTYVCTVHSNEDVSRSYVTLHYKYGDAFSPAPCYGQCVPWRAILLVGAAAALLAASMVVLHRRCTPSLLLAARIAHARATANTQRARVLEKEFDVLVCWTGVDGALARGALLPTLAQKYKYRVLGKQLENDPDTWYAALSPEVSRCRSLVSVVSPTQHSAPQLLAALRALHALPLPPVVLLLQDLPKLRTEAKDQSGDSLVGLLRRTRLLAWRHLHERAFWTALRLALPLPPPPQHPHHPHTRNENKDDKSDDEAKNSRSGSLTALV